MHQAFDQAFDLAFDKTVERFEAKYEKVMEYLAKDRDELLAFCDFPVEHSVHTKMSDRIETTFATVWLRTKRTRRCGSRSTTLTKVDRLMSSAQQRCRAKLGCWLLTRVVNNVGFNDGEQLDQSAQVAACPAVHKI